MCLRDANFMKVLAVLQRSRRIVTLDNEPVSINHIARALASNVEIIQSGMCLVLKSEHAKGKVTKPTRSAP